MNLSDFLQDTFTLFELPNKKDFFEEASSVLKTSTCYFRGEEKKSLSFQFLIKVSEAGRVLARETRVTVGIRS